MLKTQEFNQKVEPIVEKKTGPLSKYLNSTEMAPRRRPIYQDENTSSDEMSDSSYQPLQPLHKRSRLQTINMADEIVREGVKKRGRGPSKRPCLNRNAQMARENRQKKKEYIEKIETKLNQLQQENKSLNTVIQKQNIDIKKLNADVSYMKSVLNNKSSITMLLKSMNQNLEKIRRKSQKEPALPPTYQKNALSDLEPLDTKLFNDNYRIKLESDNHNNDSYQLLAEAYRMNNNMSKTTGKIAKKTAHPFEFDHNYTSTMILSTADDEDEIFHDTRQEENLKNLYPVTPVSLDGSKSEPSLDEMDDFNDFSNFSTNNIFDDLTQLDMSNSLDFGQDAATCTTLDDDFFRGLDENSGICLHVNPNRVSLEFCSSCQMNSANSVLE